MFHGQCINTQIIHIQYFWHHKHNFLILARTFAHKIKAATEYLKSLNYYHYHITQLPLCNSCCCLSPHQHSTVYMEPVPVHTTSIYEMLSLKVHLVFTLMFLVVHEALKYVVIVNVLQTHVSYIKWWFIIILLDFMEDPVCKSSFFF